MVPGSSPGGTTSKIKASQRCGAFLFNILALTLRSNHQKPKKMKQVCCRDLGNDCDFTVSGEIDEVMDAVARHAKEFHKIDVTPEVAEAVKGVMKDV